MKAESKISAVVNYKVKDLFDIAVSPKESIDAFAHKSEFVADIDESYIFNKEITLTILAALKYNKKLLLQGYHGSGKSTHIEQVCARLNWPCIRVNLDGHITRVDLIGKDAIIIEDNKQITQFNEGILPWAVRRPIVLILDEYDAARADVMFVLQRLLEEEGKLTLLDKNEVIIPHQYFRIFATANTVGTGDNEGIYFGVQPINQGQMDRWNMVAILNYMSEEEEIKILLSKVKSKKLTYEIAKQMVTLADLIRKSFKMNDLSALMSLRAVINWAQNYLIFGDLEKSFKLSFLNKCEEDEQIIIKEFYQRCFNVDI